MKKEIWNFIKKPYSLAIENKREGLNALFFFKVYLFCMLTAIVSIMLSSLIDTLLVKMHEISIYKNLAKNSNSFNVSHNQLSLIFMSVIVAPISEEILFRLPLLTKKISFIISISFMFFYFSRGKVSLLNAEDFTLIRITSSIIFFLLLYYIISDKVYNIIVKKYFNYMCWILSVLFSWLHIVNFSPIIWNLIYLYPIYLLPQLIHGIAFSFLVVKYKSILWSILLHMLINLTSIVLQYT